MRVLAAAAFAGAAGIAGGRPVTGATDASAALACANPALPAALLAGAREMNAGPGASPPPAPLRVVVARVGETGPRLRLAVAADNANRELGLMCVLHLRPRSGMIFVFPRTADWEFWMKNTLAPLDMVWILPDGKVQTVAANVPQSTLETPDGSVARRRGFGRYVIELRAGEAALDGLRPGKRLVLPTLSTDS